MERFDGHSGISRLASVLSGRMKKESASPLVLDFGEIQETGALVTATFPVPIPKGEYSVCRQYGRQIAGVGTHVLVAWVQNEAVVIDIIEKS